MNGHGQNTVTIIHALSLNEPFSAKFRDRLKYKHLKLKFDFAPRKRWRPVRPSLLGLSGARLWGLGYEHGVQQGITFLVK